MSVQDNSFQTCDCRQKYGKLRKFEFQWGTIPFKLATGVKLKIYAEHLFNRLINVSEVQACDWPVTVKVLKDIQNMNGGVAEYIIIMMFNYIF